MRARARLCDFQHLTVLILRFFKNKLVYYQTLLLKTVIFIFIYFISCISWQLLIITSHRVSKLLCISDLIISVCLSTCFYSFIFFLVSKLSCLSYFSCFHSFPLSPSILCPYVKLIYFKQHLLLSLFLPYFIISLCPCDIAFLTPLPLPPVTQFHLCKLHPI